MSSVAPLADAATRRHFLAVAKPGTGGSETTHGRLQEANLGRWADLASEASVLKS
jgi:hypothetical protein